MNTKTDLKKRSKYSLTIYNGELIVICIIVLWLLLFRIGSEILDFDTPALNLSSCGGTVDSN